VLSENQVNRIGKLIRKGLSNETRILPDGAYPDGKDKLIGGYYSLDFSCPGYQRVLFYRDYIEVVSATGILRLNYDSVKDVEVPLTDEMPTGFFWGRRYWAIDTGRLITVDGGVIELRMAISAKGQRQIYFWTQLLTILRGN
jgi:hypothetical protein